MRTVIIIICILALAATIGTIVVGTRTFDGLVVEKPYETGLAWDEIQRQKAGIKAASVAGEIHDLCDIQRGPCLRETEDGMLVELEVAPRPVKAMEELVFIVALTRAGKPVPGASVALELSMPGMYMGENRPVLMQTGPGRFEGRGVIVRCPSGKKTWQAAVIAVHGRKTAVVDFVFEVK